MWGRLCSMSLPVWLPGLVVLLRCSLSRWSLQREVSVWESLSGSLYPGVSLLGGISVWGGGLCLGVSLWESVSGISVQEVSVKGVSVRWTPWTETPVLTSSGETSMPLQYDFEE